MKHINWGIIGCGNVTEVKSGPAFNKIPGSSLVAVMRRDGAKARDYAERHGVPKWYSDAQQLIDDPEVNAVYIATPPDSHAYYTRLVAEAGKPVYVEKPMALTYTECQAMVTACEQARVPLFVAYYRRCLPVFLKVKELIDTGAIGACRLISIELWRPLGPDEQDGTDLPWRVQPAIAGGGHFVDLATHQLDLLDYVFGPITAVAGIAGNQSGVYPAEDTVSASLQFESGVIGSGLWCFSTATNEKRDLIRIIGTRGRLSFSTFDHRVPITLEIDKNTETFTPPTPPHIQQPLIETICQALQGKGHCPSTGESAARTTRVIDRILADWRSRNTA